MRHLFYTLLCAVLVGANSYALNDAWSVDIRQHTAVQRTYKQGETWTLQVSLRDGLKALDLTGASARFHWYTNATDNVWWTNSAAITAPATGLVTVPWTPAMDVGASSYAYWVGIWMPGATSPLWRVTGTIRLLPSPGFVPNAQPVPVRTLDFSAITLTNAPWVTASDWASGSNALAGAVQSLSDRVDAQAAYAATKKVTRWHASPTNWMEYTGSNVVNSFVTTPAPYWHLEGSDEVLPLTYPLAPIAETNGWFCGYDFGNTDNVVVTWFDGTHDWIRDSGPVYIWGTTNFVLRNRTTLAYTNILCEVSPDVPPRKYYLSTDPRVERVWSPDGGEYRDGTGGVWRIYDSGSTTGWVAVIPDIPEEIAIPGLAFPVASVWEGSDVSWSMTVEATGYPDVYDITFNYIGFGAWDAGNVTSTVLPIVFQTFTGSGPTQPITLEWRGAVTTQHVATVALDTSLTGLASRAELAPYVTGTVLTQQTSHVMAQWYDVTGGVTQQILRVGDQIVTNRWGPYVTLPSGIVTNITDGVTSGTYSEATRTFDISAITGKAITNNYYGDIVKINNTYFHKEGYLGVGGPIQGAELDVRGSILARVNLIAGNSVGFEGKSLNMFASLAINDSGNAYTFVDAGGSTLRQLKASSLRLGANTSADPAVELSSNGYIKFGPTVSGKQAHIFTDGTNCFFVDVNSVTNGNLTVAGTNTAAVLRSQSGYLLPHLGTNTTVSLIFTNGTLQAWEIAP